MILEALAAIARLVQPVALDHGAHGAIEDEDALAGSVLQGFDAFVSCHDAAFSFASVKALAGRRPSRWQIA